MRENMSEHIDSHKKQSHGKAGDVLMNSSGHQPKLCFMCWGKQGICFFWTYQTYLIANALESLLHLPIRFGLHSQKKRYKSCQWGGILSKVLYLPLKGQGKAYLNSP